ncbi:hypothetical protein O0V09_07165 [Dasania sp. GY-19]|uniref:Uncharacterized protein n=1 Tax=Dasania phycosphaerae TaxID=2950436 RepID=A0A9J6RJV7_9GAMM|nr:hypothetical protein [Dasania phycosphaerae]MCZ0864974.1 hypothetical protein [Dasania phycosphaerae]
MTKFDASMTRRGVDITRAAAGHSGLDPESISLQIEGWMPNHVRQDGVGDQQDRMDNRQNEKRNTQK